MRISDFRIHSIAMADPPLRSSYGLHQPYALRNVIELVSDDGVIGIAEPYGGDQPAGALEAIRGKVVGACPYRLTGDLSLMVEGGASGLERSQTYNVPGENPLDADARTYSAIAKLVHRPNAVRAAGTALGSNPIPVLVPCHRVLRTAGSLGRYALG